MFRKCCLAVVLALALLITPQFPPADAQPTDNRSFYMGFTPFPHDVDDAALTYTAERIQQDGDLIAHHFDEGIPWAEALNDEVFSQPLMAEWEYRRFITGADQQVYVAITPINLSRTGLASYHGPDGAVPLPAPWDEYTFDHPDVKTAYLNYVRRVIDYFQPDFLATGIEVNGLLTYTPELWPGYVELQQDIYTQIKSEYPDLPVMVSLVGVNLLDGYSEETDHDAQMVALAEILPLSDYFAISLYPYLSVYTTDTLPPDIFEKLNALSDKPLAIAETGYPAQPFTLTLPDGDYTFQTDADKQAAYMTLLLDSAQQYGFRFVVNFIVRDYDRVWEALGQDEDIVLWRDTGIYDEDGDLRPAGEIWLEWLALPVQSVADIE